MPGRNMHMPSDTCDRIRSTAMSYDAHAVQEWFLKKYGLVHLQVSSCFMAPAHTLP